MILAVFDDLLLGSNVLGMLKAAGYEAQLVSQAAPADLVIADLAGGADPAAIAKAAGDAKLLGVFSHVQPEQRKAALAAGFDLVVPRSRMAREGPALVHSLLVGPTTS